MVLIGHVKLNNKTYNEIFQQALNTIPILYSEWSDYNYSDPGINTLQILSIVKLFQQSYLDKIRDDVKYKFIKLLGYDVEGIKPSSTNAIVESDIDGTIYANTKMLAGDIVFENIENERIMNDGLKNIILYNNFTKKYLDVTSLVMGQTETIVYPFGKELSEESAIYFVLKKPIKLNENYNIYIDIGNIEKNRRNFIAEELDFKLSQIEYEYMTKHGWQKLNIKDNTKGFLQSGVISLNIEKEMIVSDVGNISKGYIIRAVLKKNGYDVLPRLKKIYFNICKLKQIDTQVKSFIFDSNGEDEQVITITNFLTIYNNILVLVKNEDGSYRKYENINKKQNGFFCSIVNDFMGNLEVKFSKDQHKYIPAKGKQNIKIICYNNLFHKKNNYKIYGFDEQVLKIDNISGIMEDEFSLMIKVTDDDGKENFYNIFSIYDNKESMLKYKLNNLNDEIIISEVNIVGDIELIISNCVLSKGKGGNVREGKIDKLIIPKTVADEKNVIQNGSFIENIKIKNIDQSIGGKNKETLDDMLLKIMDDISSTHSVVTEKDFQTKIFNIPGLSIHKVKAICNNEQNKVSIIVKPYSVNNLPVLTENYKNIISKYLDEYRLITTEINIVSPVYVPINVGGNIYIKSNYKDADKIIKKLIEKELDSVNSDKDFGCEIIYGNLYSKLEGLECVDEIYSLSLEPASIYAIKQINSNIVLDKNALSYLGDYNIKINNNILTVV